MKGYKAYIIGAVLLSLSAWCFAQEEDAPGAAALDLGSTAPVFKGLEWLQGSNPFEADPKPGYVLVDCWATWCGPCVASIPHMNELAAEYKDKGVAVMGVAVWDEPEKVKQFFESGQHPMSYPVAIDAMKDVGEHLMLPSGQQGIPALFVIKADTREILWIGHPMVVDDVIKKIVAGDYDIVKEKQQQAFQMKLQQAIEAKDWDQALQIVQNWQDFDVGEAVTYELWIQAQRKDEKATCALLEKMAKQDVPADKAMQIMGLMGMVLENFPESAECRSLAAEVAKQVAAQVPDETMVQGMYWFTLNADEQYDEAAGVAQKLIKMNWDDKMELVGLAKSFMLKEMGTRYLEQAAQAVDRALELDDSFAPAYLYKILVEACSGNAEQVESYGRKMLALVPADENLLNEAAWELMNDRRVQGEYNKLVLKLAEKAELITNGLNPAILDTLALACFKNGDIERAVQLEKAAIAIAPGYQALQMQLEMFEDALETQKKSADGMSDE